MTWVGLPARLRFTSLVFHLEQVGFATEVRDDVRIPDLVEHGPATLLRLESREQGPGVGRYQKPGSDRRFDEVTSPHGAASAPGPDDFGRGDRLASFTRHTFQPRPLVSCEQSLYRSNMRTLA